MTTFDLDKSQALKLFQRERVVNSVIFKILRYIALAVVCLYLFLCVLTQYCPAYLNSLLALATSATILWLWVDQYLQYSVKGGVKNSENLVDQLESDAIEFLIYARTLAEKKGGNVDAGVLWLAMNGTMAGRYFFVRCGFVNAEQYSGYIAQYWQEQSKQNQYWPNELIIAITRLSSRGRVALADLLVELVSVSKLWQDIITNNKLEVKDASIILGWYKKHKSLSEKKPFWMKETAEGVVGRDWAYGYTPNLLLYAHDLSTVATAGQEIKIYGRENETKELERALSKAESNNVVLVGEPGVGKTTIVHQLAQKISKGSVGPALLHKHIWSLDTGRLTAGADEGGAIEARLQKVLDEVTRAGNIILFIDNIHNLMSREKAAGVVNASAILLPYLRGRGLQIVGDTTVEDYHDDIESNLEVAALFSKIEVRAPVKEDVIYVLVDSVPSYEYRYGVVFTYASVKEAIRLSDRYIRDKPFPAKALEVLDDTAVAASQKRIKLITPELISETVSIKTNVPVGETTATEKERLLNLEDILHKRVIGQDEAIRSVAAALRRARSGLSRENKPVGTFLFIGPTGVGKTETAKALAEAYFGSEKRIIRLDMSEYQNQDSLSRLIGSPPGGGQKGTQGALTKAIKDEPFSVVLLDEIEKSHPNILNVFLQVLDEGRLTDGTGRTVDFTNSMIIATSNAGAEDIRQYIRQNVAYEQFVKILMDLLQKRNIFRPEFLNRFDSVVVYRPLTTEELIKVVDIMIGRVAKSLASRNIVLDVTPAAKQKLAQLGYSPEYGARQLGRTVQQKLEDPLAEKLLRDEIVDNSTVRIDVADISD